MEAANTDVTSKKHNGLDLVLTNFQLNFGALSEPTLDKLRQLTKQFWTRYCCDLFICIFIVSPCVISFWRGTWDFSNIYMDKWAFNNNCFTSNCVCFAIGASGSFLVQFNHDFIKTNIGMYKPSQDPYSVRRTAWFSLVSRVFSICWGLVDIYMWKSVWDGVDCYFGKQMEVALVTFFGGTTILVLARAFKSASSVPVGIMLDDVANCCFATTYLQTKMGDPYGKRLIDILSSIVLEIMVIFSWHGLWTLEDILSDFVGIDSTQSGWYSLSVGIPCTVTTFVLQFKVARQISLINDDKSTSACHQCLKHFLGFLFNILSLFSTVNVFRGYWYLFDEYLIPSDYHLSLINGQIYGALLLFLLYSGSSLHAGVFRDVGDENGSNMVEFYFSTYFFIKDVEAEFGGNILIRRNKIRHPKSNPLIVVSETADIEKEHAHVTMGLLGDDLEDSDDFTASSGDQEKC